HANLLMCYEDGAGEGSRPLVSARDPPVMNSAPLGIQVVGDSSNAFWTPVLQTDVRELRRQRRTWKRSRGQREADLRTAHIRGTGRSRRGVYDLVGVCRAPILSACSCPRRGFFGTRAPASLARTAV